MRNYIDELLSDTIDQFRDKPKIEGLIRAIGKQLQDVYNFYDDLLNKRSLPTAEGIYLDEIIGKIIGLTRSEAAVMSNREAGYVMDDETYRNILGYKIIMNSGNATYHDIIRGVEAFCNVYQIRYYEYQDIPATIILEIGTKNTGGQAILKNILPVKAGGVTTVYQFLIEPENIEVSTEMVIGFVHSPPLCGTIRCGTYPSESSPGHTVEADIDAEALLAPCIADGIFCNTRRCGESF